MILVIFNCHEMTSSSCKALENSIVVEVGDKDVVGVTWEERGHQQKTFIEK